MRKTKCFDIFERCVVAARAGRLIESTGRDKEFPFQDWFEARLNELGGVQFKRLGRNEYPDFIVPDSAEGYEVKGLAWPGRNGTYDSNSQVPRGHHDGRDIFYVFGRYPPKPKQKVPKQRKYPVLDLILCHGDFLNPDRTYVHNNRSVAGFGAYGDLNIRVRKMYLGKWPFKITEGTAGQMTLIVPETLRGDSRFRRVGRLTRVEASTQLVNFTFTLKSKARPRRIRNPNGGRERRFVAYRLRTQPATPVSMVPG